MVYKADKLRLRKLLMDAISLLCKNGLPVQSAFRIEATIGITLSEDEVVLVSFREVVQPDGAMGPQSLTDDEASDEEEEEEANSVLSQGDELEVPERKKTEDNAAKEGETRDDVIEDEISAWSETGNSGFVGNPGIIGNSRLRRQSSGVVENPNCPRFDRNNSSSLNHGGRRSNVVQVKDEVVVEDDEDCSFVKMEDGGHGDDAVFDPLAPDDSWMYQVYNETNLVGEFSQLTQDYEDAPSGGGLAPIVASNQSWPATPRDVVGRPSLPHRGGSGNLRGGGGVGGGGGMVRSGGRQSLPAASRSQDRSVARTLQSLCKTLASQACTNTPGDPVFCHICGARLSSNATLVKHIKGTHLALSACQCDICGQSFKWTMQLCRHRKRYHSNVAGAE